MTLCDRCFDQLSSDAVRMDDEIYCGSCAESILAADRDYQSVLDTYREKAGEKCNS